MEAPPVGLSERAPDGASRDELLRRYAASRDVELRDALVEANLGLVSQLARRFTSRGEAYDDLFQAASIGLLKAITGFDPDLGYEFGAYATKTIIGELKRHFRDKGWAVRAPRRLQELYLRIGSAVNDLSQSLGRSPTVSELAAELGVPEEAVLEATEAGQAYRSASLDAPGPTGEPIASRLDDPDDPFERAEHRRLLEPYLAALPDREREIVRLRFVEDLTQSEIAARLGISQMHVSRLLTRTLASLRDACVETGPGA